MAKPFIKSAGGKRRLAKKIISLFPSSFEYYIEGCLGGGSIFFKLEELGLLKNSRVILNEYDDRLALLWRWVQSRHEKLYSEYREIVGLAPNIDLHTPITNAGGLYLEQRALWNMVHHDGAATQTPPRNFFLRWAAFNGLWRENKDGEMNVPWNKRPIIKVPTFDQLTACSDALAGPGTLDTCILQWDINELCEDLLEDLDDSFLDGTPLHRAVLYIDPPYLGGFTQYVGEGWTREQAATLVYNCGQLASEGMNVILSHSDTPEFRELIQRNWLRAELIEVERRNIINSDGKGRGPKPELLVTGPSRALSRLGIPAAKATGTA